ncbi:MAG: insulinase family protein, partial [Deltaproteobacteria bacterium]|nr:insulinase family protein [Deltaproteobacteria bacterium]MBW2536426.1 insulinase family protein [Deltaproteobacteria bacterium]
LGRSDRPSAPPTGLAARRPPHLGPNRLPAFPLPGRDDGDRWKAKTLLATTDTTLPERFMGIRVGWERPADPFALLQQTSAGPTGPASDPALERHLTFLSKGPPARLPRIPYEEVRLAGGITARLRQDPKAPRVAITVQLSPDPLQATLGDALLLGRSETEFRYTHTVSRRNLDVGIHLAVGRLALLLQQSVSRPRAALRTEMHRKQRRALEQRPYGPSWVALSEALFPPGSRHAGQVVSPDPADSALWTQRLLLSGLAREQRAEHATISLVGHFDRKVALTHLDRALVLLGPSSGGSHGGAPDGPTRLMVSTRGIDPRLLFGWPAPAVGARDDAALQVAIQVLAGRKESRFRRELLERQLAASARGFVDPGWEASAAVLELTPAATVDVERLERQVETIVDELGRDGPGRVEIAYAKAILSYRLRKRIAQATEPPSTDLAQATLGGRIVHAVRPGFWQDAQKRLEQVDERAVRRAVAKHLTPARRVVVVSMPEAS